jgi:hypothetical protein
MMEVICSSETSVLTKAYDITFQKTAFVIIINSITRKTRSLHSNCMSFWRGTNSAQTTKSTDVSENISLRIIRPWNAHHVNHSTPQIPREGFTCVTLLTIACILSQVNSGYIHKIYRHKRYFDEIVIYLANKRSLKGY